MERFTVIFCVWLTGLMAAEAEIRTWTSVAGKTITAEYGGLQGGVVSLRANGREGRIPLSKLSAEDRAYIERIERARRPRLGGPRPTQPSGTVAEPAAAWTRYRGPNGDGRSPEKGLLQSFDTAPDLLWQADGFGQGFASVSVANGRIYTTGNTGNGQAVFAADESDGQIVWTTPLTSSDPKHGYDGSRCTPTIDGNRIYAITSDGQIASLNAADGKVIWQHDYDDWGGRMMSGWGFSESPLVDGDLVVCNPGGRDAVLVALDKVSGRVKWKCDEDAEGGKGKDGAGYGCIVVSHAGGVKQYVCLTGKGVIGVRASDGRLLWGYNRVANGTANIPTPVVIDDYVFCSSGYGDGGSALLKLSARGSRFDVEEVWWKEPNQLQNHHGGMIRLGDHIYMGHKHNSGFPTCIEWKSGNVVWGGKNNRGPGSGSAAVVYADGNLIFRYENGLVAMIEATPSSYNLKGSFTPAFQQGKSWSHPTVVNGKLFLREQDAMMCYKLRP